MHPLEDVDELLNEGYMNVSVCLSFLLQGKGYIYLPSLKKVSCFRVDL